MKKIITITMSLFFMLSIMVLPISAKGDSFIVNVPNLGGHGHHRLLN